MIRSLVFQQEQGVEPALDFDGLDQSIPHIVAYCEGLPVGTARIRRLSDQVAKLERMAVLANYRGQGIGRELLKAGINFANCQNILELRLNAQIQAREFYEKLGFEAYGDEFDEAGISHIAMRKFMSA
ncbi:MAG TPA: GNAT family N-acetyltransferase [Coleofasciculaceae cyanobacterium]